MNLTFSCHRLSLFLVILLGAVLLLAACSPVQTASGTASPIRDKEARQLMEQLSGPDEEIARVALERVLEAKDSRYVSVFIELMRGRQVEIIDIPQELYDSYVGALQTLSGETFSYHWVEWVEWYGKSDLESPPGFAEWKGKFFSRIDPRFADFLNDDARSLIRVEEIQWGGVLVDGIPALDNPKMILPDLADYLLPDESVFGIVVNGDARAYPLRIMDWHEMANDVIGGVPVSLAYCTLCGAAIAYDGRASDGQIYTFGSSGLLLRSNKLMYDRQTNTLWNHLTGEPVMGKLADRDISLRLLPVVLTTWQEWYGQHPDTLVLDINTGFGRVYWPGAAYGHYFASDNTMFPVWQRSNLLDSKAQIYALRIDGLPKAYPIDILAEEKVVNDTLGDTPVVVVASRGTVNVTGIGRYGPVTYTAGSEVRAYERGQQTFRPGPDADTVLDSASRPWQVTEEALIGPDGETAPRISGHLAYWFGWYAFFPNTLVYGQ